MTYDPSHYSHYVKRTALVSGLVNTLLSVGKIALGKIGHSQALIADGLHSVSDVFVDGAVFLAARFGNEEPDKEHPYGHGRIETLATTGIALLLFGVGVVIFLHSIQHLKSPPTYLPSQIALWMAISSILLNEGLYQYIAYYARKYESPLLKANAWHNRLDALLSFVVLVGLTGSQLGYPFLDPLCSIVISILIFKNSWELAWPSLSELIDTSLDEQTYLNIKNLIENVPGVLAVHQLRTRTNGGKILIDVHIIVSPYITVSEGHYIGVCVEKELKSKIKKLSDIVIHIDPEDDEKICWSTGLPTRPEIDQKLMAIFKDLFPSGQMPEYRIHYLKGNLELDLILSMDMLAHSPLNVLKDIIKNRLQTELNAQQVNIAFA